MKVLSVFVLMFMAQVMVAQSAADGGIYHGGWIDFNKNGVSLKCW